MVRFPSFCAILILLLSTPIFSWAQGQVRVEGTDVTVSAVFRLDGDVTPTVRDAVRRVLKTRYNDVPFLYKCYTVRFDLQLTGDGAREDLEAFSLDVVDVSSTQEKRDAFAVGGLYDLNDWRAYDAQNSPPKFEQCDSLDGGYNTECAQLSTWFEGHAETGQITALGYVEPPNRHWPANWGADYDGTIARKDGVISTEATDRVIAHEIGHMLGFKHTTSAYDLMHDSSEDTSDSLIFANIFQMLREMRLECRWKMQLPKAAFELKPLIKCYADCVNVTSGEWRYEMNVKSRGLSLSGEGQLAYADLRAEGCGCATPQSSPGVFGVSGEILDSLDRGQLFDPSVDLGYYLVLKMDYAPVPGELVCGQPMTIAKGLFPVAGAKTMTLRMKGPDNVTITDPPQLFYDKAPAFPPCAVVRHFVSSEPLEIILVEPFQDHALENSQDDCLAYTSPAESERGCN